jgi:hypothetical protein
MIMKNRLCSAIKSVFAAICLCATINAEFSQELKGIAYTVNSNTDQVELELASVRLSFIAAPLMNELPENPQRDDQKVFFFPMAHASNREIARQMEGLKKAFDGRFLVNLELVDAPIQGIKLTTQYDPLRVSLLPPDKQESQDGSYEVIFTFYNKVLLRSIQQKVSPLLNTAYQSHEHMIDSSDVVGMRLKA